MDFALIGLILIALAWIIQAIYAWASQCQIQPLFILIYVFGVAILVYDGIMNGNIAMAVANGISLIAAGAVMIAIGVK